MIRWKWRGRHVKLVNDSGPERFRAYSKWEIPDEPDIQGSLI